MQEKGIKKSWLDRLSPFQMIALFYLLAVTISCILLGMPIAHKEGVELSFIELLFTSVSAVSVTGLTVITVADTFNTLGIFLLAFVLQFGGIGIMTLGTFIWIIIGKKIGLRERRLIMTDQNQTTFQGMVRLMMEILKIILFIELIGFIILGIYFLRYFPTWQDALLQGFFASISATTNAGFDITGNSLIPFKDDYFVQFIQIIQIVLGAIGFPVLVEAKQFLLTPSRERKSIRFSLYTKVTSLTYFLLVLLGFLLLITFEWNHYFANKKWHEIIFYSLFQSVTTRNAGLSTMDVSLLTEQSQLLMAALMFIGASPSSVGGGIRTTTFALMIIFLLTFARGRRNIHIFRREVHEEDLFKAVTVTIMALFICFVATIVLSVTESFPLMHIIFEVASAFGTTGLSMGITADLTVVGKLILILLMFIGRIGILTFLFSFNTDKKKGEYHYPKERIIIG
ncbi:MAG: TrkH family potassium uptake protein [Bacillaceae bacterium]|nr:TrkH family potassium uptake protein [Bacillaceae bacterium]